MIFSLFLIYFVLLVVWLLSPIPRSSNGRTTGSGPVYWSSNLYLGTLSRSFSKLQNFTKEEMAREL